MEEELHSYIVCVEYEISCFSEEEAEMFYQDGNPVIVHIEDNGPI